MTAALIVAALACGGFLLNILIKPTVNIRGKSHSIYWVCPLIGAVLMLCLGVLSPAALWEGLTADTAVNPVKILVLFFSLTLMSVLLDSAGFFRILASKTLAIAKHSQWALFIGLYLTVSVLTVFTSNDIIVLTFTPFICYFAQCTKINPIPFLVGEFIAANTWSMALIIGNPTNIYLGGIANIGFADYISVMLVPTVFAGLASLGMLCLIFRKALSKPMEVIEGEKVDYNVPLIIIGGVHLGVCLVAMAVSSVLDIQMWLVALVCFVSQYFWSLVYCIVKKRVFYIEESVKRAPLDTIPFVLSMFTLVLAVTATGVTDGVSEWLTEGNEILKCGIGSTLCSNLINNIPMSVLFSALVDGIPPAVYASVIGSNLGAFLTPVGALAGIMWTGLLKNHGVKLSFLKFSSYGVAICVPALVAALGGLYLILG